MSWYSHRRAPCDIQRVQAEIAAVAEGATLCAMHPEDGVWRVLPLGLFHRLHALSRSGADPEEPAWQGALSVLGAWRREGAALRPGPGAVIITLGSAWWLPRYARPSARSGRRGRATCPCCMTAARWCSPARSTRRRGPISGAGSPACPRWRME